MQQDAELLTISRHAFDDETAAVQALLAETEPFVALEPDIRTQAETLIAAQRAAGAGSAVESFLQAYALSTQEGIALLCLAEALLRIPDAATADRLIDDTFRQGSWRQHLSGGDSAFVRASGWALMLTGSVLRLDEKDAPAAWFGGLIKRSGEPVIRQALRAGMKFLGRQFVMGETIAEAMKNARVDRARGYQLSYDILGEGARSDAQAQDYCRAYLEAIGALARAGAGDMFEQPGISVKLSALHPRYSALQRERVMAELLPRMRAILRAAREAGIAVAFDAEEANRLDLSLELYAAVLDDPEFIGFDGIGWVLQAYQKRAVHVARWLGEHARRRGRRLPVRLVKGAYWDSEIKQAQMHGLPGYPVFTRKAHTDLSYLACARLLLRRDGHLYPQFATHNAHTAAAVIALAQRQGVTADGFEFQRLHGMGESLHSQLVGAYRCRIYAPVGAHKDLLAYLIRRLLENGANSSFVHLLLDRATPIDALTQSPRARSAASGGAPHPDIPLPAGLYGPERSNSAGVDFGYHALAADFLESMGAIEPPAAVSVTTPGEIPAMVARAHAAWEDWQAQPPALRADCLRRAADALQARMGVFAALCVAEGKKTRPDAVAEVREAIDFLRYYAAQAEKHMTPQRLPGPTGEINTLSLHGRGVFVCISPWNFPLAIFIGQVAAALVAGNAVIAKPAEQTPAIAAAAVALLHAAGVPSDIMQLAVGAGETVGAALAAQPGIAGLCFTGSTAVARQIQRILAAGDGPLIPLIAETGGQNAMIVDSSALPEQAVDDIIASAFGAAGQRCSALRALFVQEEIAEPLWQLLCGAMDVLETGDPAALCTDIPPVIDAQAQAALDAHIAAMRQVARRHHHAPPPRITGNFVVPHLFHLDRLAQLRTEHFGPVVHFFTYKAAELPEVIAAIHRTGYGLTFGLQSRLRAATQEVLGAVRAGNRYVNRSMVGAVVGTQPFGGEGLSGTGPKAGGPYYLPRFCVERTTTINSAAIGGNVELLS